MLKGKIWGGVKGKKGRSTEINSFKVCTEGVRKLVNISRVINDN